MHLLIQPTKYQQQFLVSTLFCYRTPGEVLIAPHEVRSQNPTSCQRHCSRPELSPRLKPTILVAMATREMTSVILCYLFSPFNVEISLAMVTSRLAPRIRKEPTRSIANGWGVSDRQRPPRGITRKASLWTLQCWVCWWWPSEQHHQAPPVV